MAGLVDFTNAEEVEEYLNNTEIEFMFGCHKENNQDSCFRLGQFKETVRKQFKEAGALYTSCCERFSNAPCCYKAGQYHMIGKGGLKKSYLEAFKKYNVACSQQNYTDHGKNDTIAAACCNMAMLLAQDTENRKEYVNVLETSTGTKLKPVNDIVLNAFTRACKLNDKVGCSLLSMFYMDAFKLGVNTNLKLAASYAEKACDLGDARACHNLSIMYKRGDGVPQSNEKAAEFSNKSREMYEGNVALEFGEK